MGNGNLTLGLPLGLPFGLGTTASPRSTVSSYRNPVTLTLTLALTLPLALALPLPRCSTEPAPESSLAVDEAEPQAGWREVYGDMGGFWETSGDEGEV